MREAAAMNGMEIQELAALLKCPACGAGLEAADGTKLACPGCRREYPVVEGVPVLLLTGASEAVDEAVRFYNDIYRDDPGDQDLASRGRRTTLEYLRTNLDVKGKVVLDLGGGEGTYARELAGQGARVIVADLALPRLLRLRRDNPENLIPVCADIQAGFLRTPVDAAVSIAVVEHLPEPGKMLVELARVVRSGGRACLYVPVVNLPFPRVATGLYRRLRGFDVARMEKEHPSIMTGKKLRAELAAAGLNVLDVRYYSVLEEFRWLPHFISRLVAKVPFLRGWLAQGMFVTCVAP